MAFQDLIDNLTVRLTTSNSPPIPEAYAKAMILMRLNFLIAQGKPDADIILGIMGGDGRGDGFNQEISAAWTYDSTHRPELFPGLNLPPRDMQAEAKAAQMLLAQQAQTRAIADALERANNG